MARRFFSGLAAVVLLLSGATRARAEYIITDLGTLGGYGSWANGINDAGQVVGNAIASNGQQHAFLYSNGQMTDLNLLLSPFGNSTFGSASAINASGQVVGDGTVNGRGLPFLYNGGQMTALNFNTAGRTGIINDGGQILGQLSTGASILYSGGTVTTLPLWATAINNAGQIAGTIGQRAVLYDGGKITDLGTPSGDFSTPTAINASGQVTGSLTTRSGQTDAFLYSNGKMTDLGNLSGPYSTYRNGFFTIPLSINNAGQSVGQYGDHAFLFIDGKLKDLNSLIPADSGWILNVGTGINNKGQIVGWGTNPAGQPRAFLLTGTPVAEAPEPTSLTLLSLGGLGLAGHAWRKRRQARAA